MTYDELLALFLAGKEYPDFSGHLNALVASSCVGEPSVKFISKPEEADFAFPVKSLHTWLVAAERTAESLEEALVNIVDKCVSKAEEIGFSNALVWGKPLPPPLEPSYAFQVYITKANPPSK